MSESTDRPVVLIVDDEPDIVQIIELWLADSYEVRTATSGAAGLDALDPAVDVVLLDRRMPGISGDDVLTRIRERAEAYQVGLVTATDPDFDLIDLDFDTFVKKPLDESTIIDTVERLLARNSYDTSVQERYTIAETIALLEKVKTKKELATSDRYQELSERLATLDEVVTTEAPELSRR
jgi:DNA-binding response OmpR family regulator